MKHNTLNLSTELIRKIGHGVENLLMFPALALRQVDSL